MFGVMHKYIERVLCKFTREGEENMTIEAILLVIAAGFNFITAVLNIAWLNATVKPKKPKR